MLELSVRLIAAALIFLASAWFHAPDVGVGSLIALSIGLYSVLGYIIENRKGMNAGIAGILSVCDSGAILFLAASVNNAGQGALFAILPVLYSYRRYGANLWLTTPCWSALLFSAAAMFGGGAGAGLYAEVLAALALPLILKPGTVETAHVDQPRFLPLVPEVDGEAFLVLRENFRKMKERCRDIEQASKRDHMLAQLHGCRLASNNCFHEKFAETICALSGAQSAAFYTLSQFGATMVVRGTSGKVQAAIEDTSYSIDLTKATRQITDQVELTTRAMLDEEERSKVAAVLLTHENRVIGMINLFHTDWDELFEAKRQVEAATQVISWIITETQRKATHEKRLKELELLYETSILSSGATDRAELVERVVSRLSAFISADFLGAYLIENDVPVLASASGQEMDFLSCMSFSGGSGFPGWVGTGCPELAIFQPREDQRCRAEDLLRKRIGSFILVPLQFEERPFGFIVAVSRVSSGLENSDLAALRAVCAECSQAMCRIEQPNRFHGGLVTPATFQRIVSSSKSGCLVYFELLKRSQLLENCEIRSVEAGLREFSYRLRGKLTAGGAACQKGEGGFIVYLPNASSVFVANWANDVAATASMIGVKTTGGKTTIPLAFRAKVASLAPQSNEELAARPA